MALTCRACSDEDAADTLEILAGKRGDERKKVDRQGCLADESCRLAGMSDEQLHTGG